MIRNSLKIAIRTLLKHKLFTTINILGFALSISICLMIIIFIKDQRSSDRFHEKRNRIVRVYTTDKDIVYPSVKGYATTFGSLAPYLLDNCPYVENVVRLRRNVGTAIHNNENISIGGYFAEPSFFDVFSFRLKEGNPQTALNEPYSIILSEETAFKFFGDDNPINRTIDFGKLGNFTVTGVLRDIEERSHFIFNALFSFATIPSLENKGVLDTDLNGTPAYDNYYTYALLNSKEDVSRFKQQLSDIIDVVAPDQENERFGFGIQPLLDINLGMNLWLSMPGTRKSFDILFIPILAMLIIFLACFNYVILSAAHSLKRTQEIGFRKVIGASRIQIVRLFLIETFVITFAALIWAGILILWLVPAFNELDVIQRSDLQVNIQQLKDPAIYIIFIVFSAVLSLLAGLFPALYLSSMQPIHALQGSSKIKGLSHLPVRKILLGLQFAVSLMFVIFTVYYYRLHTSWMDFDYGMKTEDLVNVNLGDINYQAIRDEINANSYVTGISFSNEIPVFGNQRFLDIGNEHMEKSRSTCYYSVDPEFINNFHLQLVAGRNFSDAFSTDVINAIIINQQALQEFDLGSPAESIGKSLVTGDSLNVTVIGVIKDFNYYFPDEPINPLILQYRPEEFRFVNISYGSGMKNAMKAYLPDIWKKFDKERDINLEFFDDAKQEASGELGGIIGMLGLTCGFIILFALFGLLGMASYTTETRTKEIGIRKVLGSSVPHAAYLLSIDYVKLISFSAIFALPAAYLLSKAFYNYFPYSPDLNLWVLPGSLTLVMILALITIGSQTTNAARKNPSLTLKEG